MNRTRALIGTVLATAVALAGLSGCGRLSDRVTDAGGSTALSWDEQALQQLGFASGDLYADSSEPTRPRVRHPRLRYLFSHTLHGEATVQTEEGVLTVVAQRGMVTEVGDDSLTVESEDGFVLTWVVNDRTVVVVEGARSEFGAVPEGAEVGVAGSRDGETVVARRVVRPRR